MLSKKERKLSRISFTPIDFINNFLQYIKIRLFDDFKNSYIYNCKNKTPFLNKQGRGINPRGTTLVIPEKRRVSPLSFNAGVRWDILLFLPHSRFPKRLLRQPKHRNFTPNNSFSEELEFAYYFFYRLNNIQ